MSKKVTKYIFFLTIVILLGVVLRLIRLQELFHFTYDEEIFAFVGKRMFVNRHIPLIGGVTPMHVHLAPYFYWLSGIILFLSRLYPLGWGVAAAFIAGATMVVLYQIGKEFFHKYVGIFAVVLYAFSFYQNIFDRHYWGLAFNGLISLLSLFSLYKISKGKQKFVYLLAATLSFGFHTDPSTLVLFVLSFIFLFGRFRVDRKHIVGAIAFFLFSFAPLVLFDVRHDFVNIGGISQYIQEIQKEEKGNIQYKTGEILLFVPRSLARLGYMFGNTDLARQYSYCPQHAVGRLTDVPIAIAFFIILVFFFFVHLRYKTKNRVGFDLIILLYASAYIGISVYGLMFKGDLFDHYLSILFPIFFLILGVVLKSFWDIAKFIPFVLLFVFVLFNLQQLFTVNHRFGYADKVSAVQWIIEKTGEDSFSLDVMSSCFRYNGYRYLFYAYGKEPVKSYVDANFSHLYDVSPVFDHPKLLVVITNPDFQETEEYYEQYDRYQKKVIERVQFGDIEVLLIDNSDLDFVGDF